MDRNIRIEEYERYGAGHAGKFWTGLHILCVYVLCRRRGGAIVLTEIFRHNTNTVIIYRQYTESVYSTSRHINIRKVIYVASTIYRQYTEPTSPAQYIRIYFRDIRA